MNSGSFWINSTGIHSTKQTRAELSEFDEKDEYGIYNNMDKFAETEKYIFFINFFGELVRFNKSDKSFEYVFDKLIDDFYVTDESIYYVYNSELYETDYEGKKEDRLCDFIPNSIKYDNGKIYVRDNDGGIYLVNENSANKICNIKADCWTVADGKIYYYNTDESKVGCVSKGIDTQLVVKPYDTALKK